MTISEEEIQRLYVEEEMTQQEVAEELGYQSRQPVQDAMEKFDIQTRSSMTISEEEVRRLYVEEEMTQQEVAEELGYQSRTPVVDAMKKFDIQSRSRGSKNRNAPWKDESTLRELYHEEGMSLRKIGDKLGCDSVTVHNQMKKMEIPRRERTHRRQRHAGLSFHGDGYEMWNDKYGCVLVHRLAAVAWFGMEAIKDKDIHHISEIPWDNREENLVPLTRSEHMKRHS